jgi:hypothetical protein
MTATFKKEGVCFQFRQRRARLNGAANKGKDGKMSEMTGRLDEKGGIEYRCSVCGEESFLPPDSFSADFRAGV